MGTAAMLLRENLPIDRIPLNVAGIEEEQDTPLHGRALSLGTVIELCIVVIDAILFDGLQSTGFRIKYCTIEVWKRCGRFWTAKFLCLESGEILNC